MVKRKQKKATEKVAEKARAIHHYAEKELDFMVQISDSRMLRKDILEAIREIIMFMQGYEKFRKIQEEKTTMFNELKSDIRNLNNLIDDKLRKAMPKGKLRGVEPGKQAEPEKKEIAMEKPTKISVAAEKKPASELDELESQLKEIENQLQGMN